MDIGIDVKCHRCLQKFYLYAQTHGYKITLNGPQIGGMCPNCNARVTSMMSPHSVFIYNARKRGVTYGDYIQP